MTDGRGLYLVVTPAGGKLWQWKYRFQGAEKLMSLEGIRTPSALAPAVFSAFRFSIGSTPLASSFRAAAWRSLASTRETVIASGRSR